MRSRALQATVAALDAPVLRPCSVPANEANDIHFWSAGKGGVGALSGKTVQATGNIGKHGAWWFP
jgi:hypothetical protein